MGRRMATIRDVVAELMDEMGIPADRRDDVDTAVRTHIEGTYDDAMLSAARLDETGELTGRRETLSRRVWAALDLGAYPW